MIQLSGETQLSHALDAIPGALDYIVSLNSHDFERLRNPFMRRYMSPRIRLRRVAAMAGVPEERLLRELAALAGGTAEVVDGGPAAAPEPPQSPPAVPAWLADVDEARLHWVDVLPIDDVLGDPLLPINLGVKRMAPGGVIGIRHKWEPQPLYDIWQKMGLEWFARQVGPDEWRIFVHRPASLPPLAPQTGATADLRGLPADEPAPRATAMFEQLGVGEHLDVWVDAPDVAEQVRAAVARKHGGAHTWEERGAGPDKRVIRILRTG